MTRALLIVVAILFSLLIGAGVVIRTQAGDIADVSAEKATIQSKLDAAQADIEKSEANHDRMLAEKDAQLAIERRQNSVILEVNTQLATTQGNITNAEDDTKCAGSAAVGAAIDGLQQLERSRPQFGPVDRVPPASRVGKAAKPGRSAGPAKGRR